MPAINIPVLALSFVLNIVDINTPENFEEDKWKLLIGEESSKITIDNLEW